MNPLNKQIYRVVDVEVDATRACLKRDGQEQHLRPQTFQVLLYLIEHRERGVTKEELIRGIWQGMAVTDDALVQCIMEIRRALGDDSRHPRFVKTIPKFGYSFIAPVKESPEDSSIIVQTEEITSIKLEYEEETDPATSALAVLPAPPALAPPTTFRQEICSGFCLSVVFGRGGRLRNLLEPL